MIDYCTLLLTLLTGETPTFDLVKCLQPVLICSLVGDSSPLS